jgi:hypothetical protein
LLAAAAMLAALSIVRRASADDLQIFELAKNRIDAGQYNEAIEQFAVMLDPEKPPCQSATSGGCRLTDADLIERARTYYAVALVAVQRPADAEVQIAQILRKNPAFSPDPALFPAEVIDRFTQVRGRLREELEAVARKKAEEERRARLAVEYVREQERRELEALRRLAGQETVVEVHSRWIAALPFGVGQFQNGQKGLGWFFLASQAVMGGVSIGTSASLIHYNNLNEDQIDKEAVNATIADIQIINGVAFGAWASLVVAGVVQAQIAFVPERVSVRPRRPPANPRPVLKAMPVVSIQPGGLYLGVAGQF